MGIASKTMATPPDNKDKTADTAAADSPLDILRREIDINLLITEIDDLKKEEVEGWMIKSLAKDEDEYTREGRLRLHDAPMAELERFRDAVLGVVKVKIPAEGVLKGELEKLKGRHARERREESLKREGRHGERSEDVGGGQGGDGDGGDGDGGGANGGSQGSEKKGEEEFESVGALLSGEN